MELSQYVVIIVYYYYAIIALYKLTCDVCNAQAHRNVPHGAALRPFGVKGHGFSTHNGIQKEYGFIMRNLLTTILRKYKY